MADSGNRTIVILGAVLLAIAIVAIVIFVLLPGDGGEQGSLTSEELPKPTTGVTSTEFDLGTLNRRVYQLLNRQLVQEGAIPVQPPEVVGKPNPFL